jgi:hypothetical protein
VADPAVVVPPVPGSPEHDAALAAKYDAAQGVPGATDDSQGATPDAADARPAWLPEKFKTPEEFAKSYDELQKKLGAPAEPAVNDGDAADAAARATVADAGLDFDKLADAYAVNGQLGDEDYATLEAAGIPKDIVDGFIAGQMAVAENLRSAAFATAGGEENYKAMIGWATANMSAAEVAAFNQTVAGNSADQIKFAVSGLKARYEAVNGSDPKLMGGDGSNSQGDTFATWFSVKEAMKDPRYSKDAQYRRGIEDKLGRSSPV